MKSLILSKWFSLLAYFLVVVATIGAASYASIALGDFINNVIKSGFDKSYLSFVLAIVFQIAFRIGNVFGEWVYERLKLAGIERLLLNKLQAGKGFETAWNESNKYFDSFFGPIFHTVHACLGIFGSIGVIAVVSWPVALVALGGFFVAYAFSYFMKKRLAAASKQHLEASNDLSGLVNRTEANMPSFGNRGMEQRLAIAPSQRLRDASRRQNMISSARDGMLNFTSGGLYVAIIVATAFLINSGQTNVGTLVVAGTVAGTIYGQIGYLANYISTIKANKWVAKIKEDPIFNFADLPPPKTVIEKVEVQNIGKTIDQKNIFKDVSLSLQAGESLRVKGPNGSGKTTMARILCGMDNATEGKILQAPAPRETYEKMPFFYQTSSSKVLAGTVRQNLTCFADKYDKKYLMQVTRKLHIEKLLDRDVSQLSSGEQALVKIAMTILSRMSVKIYDELFANVDAQKRSEVVAYALQSGGINIVAAHHGVEQVFSKELVLKKEMGKTKSDEETRPK